jgi:predicted acetyltransferase
VAIEIRQPADEGELRSAMAIAFTEGITDDDWERERITLPLHRAVAAFDDGRAVALAGAYEFDLTIPGGQLPCAGVTWVGVQPTHRRQGILRGLMAQQLEDAREWGEPIAALWASEAAIYGRFGYGTAAPGIVAKSDPQRFALKDGQPSNVAVRLTDADEAYRLFPHVYDRFRSGRAGMLSRSETWWKEVRLADPKAWRRGASQKFYAVAEVDGTAEAYSTYRIKDKWEEGFSKSEVRVVEAIAATTVAERELWRFLHSIDLTVKVDVGSLDPASSLVLGVRDPRALGLRLADALWLRLVDLDAALKARSYKPGQSIVLEVTDELCPWNAGRYRVGDDAGRTEDTADLALDVADLASVYLGAFDFHRLVHAGRAQERREGAAEAATLLFRTDLPPYCPEGF